MFSNIASKPLLFAGALLLSACGESQQQFVEAQAVARGKSLAAAQFSFKQCERHIQGKPVDHKALLANGFKNGESVPELYVNQLASYTDPFGRTDTVDYFVVFGDVSSRDFGLTRKRETRRGCVYVGNSKSIIGLMTSNGYQVSSVSRQETVGTKGGLKILAMDHGFNNIGLPLVALTKEE